MTWFVASIGEYGPKSVDQELLMIFIVQSQGKIKLRKINKIKIKTKYKSSEYTMT